MSLKRCMVMKLSVGGLYKAFRKRRTYSDMTGVILTGGKSKRMGRDKALVPVGGIPVIKRILNVFEKIFGEIFIVSSQKGLYGEYGYEEIIDLIPGKGPMMGIYTALYYVKEGSIFVASCDLPFICPSVVRFFVKEAKGNDYDIIVPYIDGRLHPLHGIYGVKCMSYIMERIKDDLLDLRSFIEESRDLSIRRVVKDELIPMDPELWSFFNMNTEEDLLEAERFAKSIRKEE